MGVLRWRRRKSCRRQMKEWPRIKTRICGIKKKEIKENTNKGSSCLKRFCSWSGRGWWPGREGRITGVNTSIYLLNLDTALLPCWLDLQYLVTITTKGLITTHPSSFPLTKKIPTREISPMRIFILAKFRQWRTFIEFSREQRTKFGKFRFH